jgi:hypothetical protein
MQPTIKNKGIREKNQKTFETNQCLHPPRLCDINSIKRRVNEYIHNKGGCSVTLVVEGEKRFSGQNSYENEYKQDKIISRHNSICIRYDVQIVGAF